MLQQFNVTTIIKCKLSVQWRVFKCQCCNHGRNATASVTVTSASHFNNLQPPQKYVNEWRCDFEWLTENFTDRPSPTLLCATAGCVATSTSAFLLHFLASRANSFACHINVQLPHAFMCMLYIQMVIAMPQMSVAAAKAIVCTQVWQLAIYGAYFLRRLQCI